MSIPATKRPRAFHPGRMLQRDFLEELEITQKQLAEAIGVSPAYINDIVQGKRGISAIMAIKLEIALDYPARMWLKLQSSWDLQEAEHQRSSLKVKVLRKFDMAQIDGSLPQAQAA